MEDSPSKLDAQIAELLARKQAAVKAKREKERRERPDAVLAGASPSPAKDKSRKGRR